MTDNREFELQDKVAERDARIEVLEAEVKEARRGCDVRDESLIKALDERDAVFKTLDYATAHAGRLMEEVGQLKARLCQQSDTLRNIAENVEGNLDIPKFYRHVIVTRCRSAAGDDGGDVQNGHLAGHGGHHTPAEQPGVVCGECALWGTPGVDGYGTCGWDPIGPPFTAPCECRWPAEFRPRKATP
uniref:Uncharacterized protein n=1 Tax=viral metagenome TaxID=1070528 RepID=A0A6M3M0L4_9ZZZZ